jgi:Domain of unknown function (DUF4249)
MINRALIGAVGFLGAGCTRVVDLGLAEGAKRLVVEGRIERHADGRGAQRIRLSLTDGLTNQSRVPPATGARASVADSLGRVVVFTESPSEPGLYLTNSLVPLVGERYTLSIDYQGERYAGSDRLQLVAPIDSLYFTFKDKGPLVQNAGFRALIDYRDPPGLGNYYLWELVVNDTLRLSPDPGNQFRVISDDRFYDGGVVIGYQPFDEEALAKGDRVRLRQLGLSEPAYRYYVALFEQSDGSGSPFSVPAASVRGNVANLTDPSHYPLGYFLAAQVSEKEAVVP